MLNETVQHYDLDVAFFKLFLDPYMKYTSGLFETESEDLYLATRRMLDRIIESANIFPGCRVLEIGPGWGSLLRRMQERGIIADYLGVSPSSVQNNHIREFAQSGEHLVTSTFEQFYSPKKYDAIVLIGSFCHLKNKPQQLLKMYSLLANDGVIVIEDTFFSSREQFVQHEGNEATRFLQSTVFGYAEILPLSTQIEQFADAGFKVSSMYEHSSSYRTTISNWLKKLKQLDTHQFPNAKDFIKYMSIAQRGWGKTTQNHLVTLKRQGM